MNDIERLRRQLLDVKSLAEETNQVEAIASAVDGLADRGRGAAHPDGRHRHRTGPTS